MASSRLNAMSIGLCGQLLLTGLIATLRLLFARQAKGKHKLVLAILQQLGHQVTEAGQAFLLQENDTCRTLLSWPSYRLH